jgi:type II pantothenate kinase
MMPHCAVTHSLQVSPAVAAEAQECDLLVLEGMGRAIETNLLTQFTCDAWMLGMVKHPEVAACLGGRMYDCVCNYTPGCSSSAAANRS